MLAAACGDKSGARSKEASGGSGSNVAAERSPYDASIGVGQHWLVVRGDRAYASVSSDFGAYVTSQLRRSDSDQGRKWEQVSTRGLSPPHTFVVDGSNVYWIWAGKPLGALVRVSFADPLFGIDVMANPKAQKTGFAVASDGTHAFWRADGELVMAPLAGGDTRTLAPSDGDGPLLVAAGSVFHTVPGGIAKVSLDGRAQAQVATEQGTVVALASDGNRVAWLTKEGAVRVVAATGDGAIAELAKGIADPGGLTFGGDTLYVATANTIVPVPLAGGGAGKPVVTFPPTRRGPAKLVSPVFASGDLLWIDATEHALYLRTL